MVSMSHSPVKRQYPAPKYKFNGKAYTRNQEKLLINDLPRFTERMSQQRASRLSARMPYSLNNHSIKFDKYAYLTAQQPGIQVVIGYNFLRKCGTVSTRCLVSQDTSGPTLDEVLLELENEWLSRERKNIDDICSFPVHSWYFIIFSKFRKELRSLKRLRRDLQIWFDLSNSCIFHILSSADPGHFK